MSEPTHLRVEHLDDPIGIDAVKPRMSWRLPTDARTQVAYQIRAGDWDSGRIESDRSVLVPYEGPALTSREQISWTVKVWTDAGQSEWAKPAFWEMGLLDPADWTAAWIGPPDVVEDRPHPVSYFRGTCTLKRPVESARLYVTAHGLYEFFVNGARVGNMELTPGFTSYASRLQVQTFDVTNLLRPGRNVLDAVVSGGWIKWAPNYRHLPLSLLAQLEVLDVNGVVTRTGTGSDWRMARGALRSADLQQGCFVDLRQALPEVGAAKAPADIWSPVTLRPQSLNRLVSSPSPPVRRVQDIRPTSITRLSRDRQIVDLGQNINGWIRLKNLGPTGTEITTTHGERLGADGDLSLSHILPEASAGQFQQDRVISAGRVGECFEPRHATKGFRYVRVQGHPDTLTSEDVVGVVVHTDMPRTGWFECDNDLLNRLHDAVVWSFRGNACDIPTDCPTRERAGWTGDWQVFVPTASFLFDVAGFTTKWLRDLAADQTPDGLVRHCAPEFMPLGGQVADGMPPGCAGFADAAVIVPWEIYKVYGDRELLERQWGSMTAWVDYAASIARGWRHASRIAARAQPAAHERYLWDTGFHWGEWNEPDMPLELERVRDFVAALSTADHGNVATAYLYQSAKLLTRIAAALGREDAHSYYGALASRVKAAWQKEFLGADGTISPHTQAAYVRALAFELIPSNRRTDVIGHLVDLIRNADVHLATGFLATPYLLPVLADNGHLDLAYDLLLQDTPPSWLAMINQGATTIWEHWYGITGAASATEHAGVGSLNHFSKGVVASFLHRYVAGIQTCDDQPGYKRFRVAPQPGGGLRYAHASHESPYGRIESSWRIRGDLINLTVNVPPGTTAEVLLPDGQVHEAQPGVWNYRGAVRGRIASLAPAARAQSEQ